jgi:hypothetical protein
MIPVSARWRPRKRAAGSAPALPPAYLSQMRMVQAPRTASVGGFQVRVQVQVAVREPFQDPGRRVDLGLGRLEDRRLVLSLDLPVSV